MCNLSIFLYVAQLYSDIIPFNENYNVMCYVFAWTIDLKYALMHFFSFFSERLYFIVYVHKTAI